MRQKKKEIPCLLKHFGKGACGGSMSSGCHKTAFWAEHIVLTEMLAKTGSFSPNGNIIQPKQNKKNKKKSKWIREETTPKHTLHVSE